MPGKKAPVISSDDLRKYVEEALADPRQSVPRARFSSSFVPSMSKG